MKITYAINTSFLVLCLTASQQLFSQDTTSTWMFSIDTAAFTTFFDKNEIPKELYYSIGIESKREIANPHMPYQKGCVGNGTLPRKRLNWIAQDTSNHWVLSISYGGIGSGSQFYFFDKDSGKLNANVFYLQGINPEDYSLQVVLSKLKSKQFIRGSVR